MLSYRSISPQDQEVIVSLFEAVYRKERETVKALVVSLLESILRRFPERPQKGDEAPREAFSILEVLGVDFDEEYRGWLRKQGIAYTESYQALSKELLLSRCENPRLVSDLIFNTMHYIDWRWDRYYEYDQLIQALKDYKKLGETKVFEENPPHRPTMIQSLELARESIRLQKNRG